MPASSFSVSTASKVPLYNPILTRVAVKKSERWGIIDVVAMMTIASLVFQIVNVPLIPIAPSVFMPFVLLTLMYLGSARSNHNRAEELIEFWVLLAMVVYQVFMLWQTRGAEYTTFSLLGRTLASFVTIVSMTAYMTSSTAALKRCWYASFVCCLISLAWFLCEIGLVEPFVSIRNQLYLDIYESKIIEGSETVRTGLAPFPHLLGYQLAFCLPMLVGFFALQKRRLLIKIAAAIVIFTALSFSAQRSAFAGAAVALMLLAIFAYGRYRPGRIVFFIGITIFTFVVITSLDFWHTESLQKSLGSKLMASNYWEEASFRIDLQAKALSLIFAYPRGLDFYGLNWEIEGFWPTYRKHEQYVITTVMSPHNGYLSGPLEIGLPFFIMTLAMLFLITKRIITVLKQFRIARVSPYFVAMVTAATSVILVQSMGHNGSFVTLEPISVLCVVFVMVAELYRRKGLLSSPDLN